MIALFLRQSNQSRTTKSAEYLVFFFSQRDMNRRHAHKAYTGVYGRKGHVFAFYLCFRTAFMRGTRIMVRPTTTFS